MAGINRFIFDSEPFIDLTNDTVTPETLQQGYTAHNASGDVITGTKVFPDFSRITVTADVLEKLY